MEKNIDIDAMPDFIWEKNRCGQIYTLACFQSIKMFLSHFPGVMLADPSFIHFSPVNRLRHRYTVIQLVPQLIQLVPSNQTIL